MKMEALRIYLTLLFISFSILTIGQNNPVAHFSFDNCQLSDVAGNYNDAIIDQNINCDCGVGPNSDAYYFDGSSDTMFLDNSLNSLFSSDFSVGFYFWVNPSVESYALMAVRDVCNRDSSFIIQYLPSSDEIIVEFSRNIAEGVFFRNSITSSNCWHHVMFTREDQLYSLYIDGKFIQSLDFLSQIELGKDYEFTVGYSPCVGITDQFFDGRIDEIRFYDFALKEDDIRLDLMYPDEIITQDTTIFLGDQLQVLSGGTCAPNIMWNPNININDPFSIEPIVDPETTTLYTLVFDHGICQSFDSLLVSVVSPDDILCENLLFPKAFTPNNDGLNDEFGISNEFVVEDLIRFEIYNRWGMKLFESIIPSEKWDGRYKGEFQSPGTYVYKVEYSCIGEQYTKTGSFNILR